MFNELWLFIFLGRCIYSVLTIGGDMETVTKVVKDVMKHLDRVSKPTCIRTPIRIKYMYSY